MRIKKQILSFTSIVLVAGFILSGCGKSNGLTADGIVIEGEYNPAVSVEYSNMTSTCLDYEYIVSNIDRLTEATAALVKTIYLYDKAGNIVEPASTITVTLDIPEDLKSAEGDSYAVYYVNVNTGAFEQFQSSYTDTKITFRTTYLNTIEYNPYGDVFYNATVIIKENGAGGVVSLDGKTSKQNEEENPEDAENSEEIENSEETGNDEEASAIPDTVEKIEYIKIEDAASLYECGLTKEDFDISNINHFRTGNGMEITSDNYADVIENKTYEDIRISGMGTGSTARGISIGATAAEVIAAYGEQYALVENTFVLTFDDEFDDVDELIYSMKLDTGDAVRIEFSFDKEQKLVAMCYAYVYQRNLPKN